MTPSPSKLVATGLLALPGAAGAMAVAAAPGVLAAGDDRGEAGLWDRDGRRLGGWRLRGAVAWADVDGTIERTRAAFVSAGGEAIVVSGNRSPLQVALRPGDRVLLDRLTAGFYVVTPATGDVVVHDALGSPTRRFVAPAPVYSAIAVPRTGGIATTTREGVFGRFTPWGALSWGGDYRRYTGGLAVDPGGEMLVVSFLAHGAEVLHPSTGGRLGVLDLGRAVECAAVSSTHVALGCSDGTIALHDRAGTLVARGRASSKVVAIGVADGGAIFVRLADGTVRTWALQGAERATPRPRGDAPAPAVAVVRRPLARTAIAASRPCVHVADDGSSIAVVESGRNVVVFGEDGTRTGEAGYQGILLGLHVRSATDVLLVTTQEVRRIRADGGHEVRRFGVEQVRAAWSEDGSHLAMADEMGVVRLVDAETATDVFEVRLPQGEVVDRLVATALAAVVQTRSGAVRTVIEGASREIVVLRSGEAARLAGATGQGPVLVFGSEIVACTWDGQERWSHRSRTAPSAVVTMPDDRVLVVLADALQIVGRDGRADAPVRRPEGELVSMAGGGPAAFAWRDGRRVTVADAAGRATVTETFDGPVHAVALSGAGRVAAVVLDGSLAIVRALPPADPSRQLLGLRIASAP